VYYVRILQFVILSNFSYSINIVYELALGFPYFLYDKVALFVNRDVCLALPQNRVRLVVAQLYCFYDLGYQEPEA